MKKFILSTLFLLLAFGSMNAQSVIYGNSRRSSRSIPTYQYEISPSCGVRYQRGYTRSDGTFVSPHMKTRRNDTNWDNFTTNGNINPYTSERGSRARDYSLQSYNYGSGSTIYTGPKGGQYYINSRGNRTYVPKRRF